MDRSSCGSGGFDATTNGLAGARAAGATDTGTGAGGSETGTDFVAAGTKPDTGVDLGDGGEPGLDGGGVNAAGD